MGLWMWRVGGCLLLLAITLFAVVAVTDVYASVTALRSGGVPGTMIIASQDRTLPIDFFCFAEGKFAPDGGGPVVDVALAGWCGEPGTEVKVRYVPSLREHLPLLQVGVGRGTWAELATVTAGGSIFIGAAFVAWWVAVGVMLDPGVSEERYGAIRVASNCAEADLVDWLQENFDAAWVEPLPGGGSAVNLAIIDDDVVVSEYVENLSEVGRSLAEVGGVACILWWPHHIHFEGDSIEEAQSWGACSLQPDDVRDTKNVTLLRHDPQDGMPGVDVDTGAVMRGGWLLIPGDSASHNSAELHTSAAVLGVKGNEVNLDVHENGRLVGRARWNHPGHLDG